MVKECIIGDSMEKCINIIKDSDCCGCRACENICPKKAIKMVENSEGFLYPEVDKEKCVNCGLCTKICPWLNKIKRDKYLEKPICYAAKAKDKKIQKNSSSGGLFGVIAEYVLNNNGVVFGSTMTDKLKVKHIMIEKKEELIKIMGSKYVISDTKGIYSKVKEELLKKKYVLFSGVPCQISALLNYLQKDYENLITVEIVCHGVPSQKLFDKYIEYLENKFGGKILNYQFRSKKAANWGTFKGYAELIKDNKIVNKKINADFDPYYWSFLYSKNYRESCYNCKFANNKRNADITLGDFWGIENVDLNFVDYDGVSAVILNTKKAKEYFNKISDDVEKIEVSYEDICKSNGQLKNPSKRPAERDNWYQNINNSNFIKNIKISNNLRDYVKIIFPQKLKFKIKKLIKNSKC